MNTRVKWLDNMSFVGESGSGHSVVMDGPPEHGGRNLGVRPMEMLLLGLGGCASFDVVSMLKKSKQDIQNCEVEITAERAETEPKVFTKIHLHFIISGNDISEKRVARAIELSADKYCSASIMLGKLAKITHDYEIK
ncbi:OsmC family protein [Cocleimonas sp. KMM 6892]|uniref:OsmC family protein n=1 Tax=unclassified Cocleimonas TaxID=2639732 RepID=UPI002DBB7219|nr:MULTISPECIES: OsmC family protein [unclassified Cocleimonas]MEB8431289.1 OsmC family protein [Cocleimonas sp. KMM 6892]MEC4713939.1 OsmC family protein [Cocleimonas sp. KMM 6895]MEC4743270.1 OsmC family protein [Cocleimonas sp. KMM 6896]